jgi:hypothetical protein
MSESQSFVRRDWFAVDPDGRRTTVRIRIGAPAQTPGREEWRAQTVIEGGLWPSVDIHGMDSWQCLEMAIFHAWNQLDTMESRGWRFYWEEDEYQQEHPTATALDLLPKPLRSEVAPIHPGKLYMDREFHPCLCTDTSKFHVWGISLVDGSMPRVCDLRDGSVRALSAAEAYLVKTAGPRAAGVYVDIPGDKRWWEEPASD